MSSPPRAPSSEAELQRIVAEQAARLRSLEQSEQQLRGFLESASQGAVAAANRGGIVLVNAKTEELFGYCRKELLGQSLELLLPERLRNRHAAYRKDYFAAPPGGAVCSAPSARGFHTMCSRGIAVRPRGRSNRSKPWIAGGGAA